MTITTTDGGVPIVPGTEALFASYEDNACEAIGLMFLSDPDLSDELGLTTRDDAALVAVDLTTRPDVTAALHRRTRAIPQGTAVWRFIAIEPDRDGVDDDEYVPAMLLWRCDVLPFHRDIVALPRSGWKGFPAASWRARVTAEGIRSAGLDGVLIAQSVVEQRLHGVEHLGDAGADAGSAVRSSKGRRECAR